MKNLKRKMFCGATAALLSQGCRVDLTHATEEELKNTREVFAEGNEFFAPVLKEMARSAQNQQNVFGFDEKTGSTAFEEMLDEATRATDRVLKNERLFTFNNPEYRDSIAAFYRDVDLGEQLDLIAVNNAFTVIVSVESVHDWDVSKELCPSEDCRTLTWDILAHEGAHEKQYHQDGAKEAYKKGDDQTLLDMRDPAFLISLSGEDLGIFFDLQVAQPTEHLRLWLEAEIQEKNNSPYNFELSRDYVIAKLERLLTPEGWAEERIKADEFKFFNTHWQVPLEEQRRIIAESGWYEEFVEEEMREFVSEARHELGLEFVEGEPISPEDELRSSLYRR
jgi:hypothetical protein